MTEKLPIMKSAPCEVSTVSMWGRGPGKIKYVLPLKLFYNLCRSPWEAPKNYSMGQNAWKAIFLTGVTDTDQRPRDPASKPPRPSSPSSTLLIETVPPHPCSLTSHFQLIPRNPTILGSPFRNNGCKGHIPGLRPLNLYWLQSTYYLLLTWDSK